ncbi:histidine kinase [Kribbella sp. NPDC048915]|uniref:sensor histidine kinase n=1 Tax=Kribbella sp. NPDC048915 TaxID=3155148 RepID=UPI0033FA0C0C
MRQVGTGWRAPTVLVDGALAALCLAATIWPGLQSGLFDGYLPWFEWRAPAALEVGVGVLTAATVFVRRRRPLLLSLGALVSWGFASAWPALLIAQYGVGAYVGATRWSAWIRGGVTAVTVADVAWPLWREAGPDGSMPVSVVLCVLPMMLGLYLVSHRQVVANLQEQARTEERAQIARDLHDVVTHRVSLMVLHATALEADGKDPAGTARRIQEIGRTALGELRTVVGVLRDGTDVPLRPQPGLADLDELVETSRELGLDVGLTVDRTISASSMVEQAIYRVVQEALTNVHKHAPGARANVEVSRDGDGVRLVVRNRGGTGISERRAGHGLLGIAERVRLVGGALHTTAFADGFELVVSLPGATS